ncbi:hypothetical protein CKA32_000400 [Geitlerinema sp. FC II]|nr:hypothetical protein [Geitlerinema sp. CS-897]PPT09912.1 hypothetical protein CKA32_000400 [Geitlerinema sp. FC II]
MQSRTTLALAIGFVSILFGFGEFPAFSQGICNPNPTPADGCAETPLQTYIGTVRDTPTQVTTYASGWVEIHLGETVWGGYRDETGRVAVSDNLSYRLTENADGLQLQQWRDGVPTSFTGQLVTR